MRAGEKPHRLHCTLILFILNQTYARAHEAIKIIGLILQNGFFAVCYLKWIKQNIFNKILHAHVTNFKIYIHLDFFLFITKLANKNS